MFSIDDYLIFIYNDINIGGVIINDRVGRITVLWALSEAAFGGVLHALNIPFAGLFIGAGAVIFISLIGYYSENRKAIMRSVMIVLLIKAGVSPHSPPLAYFAVALQGLIGSLFFLSGKFYRLSSLLFGIIVLLLSSLQKILLLTIIYGNNLWYSIDQFGVFVTEQIPYIDTVGETSLWLIGIYSGLHLIGGVVAGYIAGALPGMVKKASETITAEDLELSIISAAPEIKKRKKRVWFRKPSSILIVILAFFIVVLTYIFPAFSESVALRAVVMIVRALLIMGLWFFVISPLVIRWYKVFFRDRKGKYAGEIENTLSSFPLFKSIVTHSWKKTAGRNFFRRVKEFMIIVLVYILRTDTGEKT